MTTQGGSYSWNAICDVCGFQYKAKDLRKRWDGLMVCKDDFEVRHPLDFYRVKNDHHQLPFTRPNDVVGTGFLSVANPTTTPTLAFTLTEVGNKFVVGSSDRRLLGVRLGGIFTASKYISTLPVTIKLWNSSGSLLTSWSITKLDFPFKNAGQFAYATAQLLPTYTLSASTTYTLSVGLYGTNGLATSLILSPAEPHLTYSLTAQDDDYLYPTSSSGTVTAHIDAITGSTN